MKSNYMHEAHIRVIPNYLNTVFKPVRRTQTQSIHPGGTGPWSIVSSVNELTHDARQGTGMISVAAMWMFLFVF